MPKPEKIKANRRAALAAVILSMAFLLARQVYNAVAPQGSGVSAVSLIAGAFSFLFYLKLLFPFPRGKHREGLIAVLAVQLLGLIAGFFTITDSTSSLPVLFGALLGIPLSLPLLPQFWIFISALRRKNMARAAANVSILWVVFLLLSSIVVLSGGEQMAQGRSMLPTFLFMAVNFACMCILLRSWPVLSRPILDKSSPPIEEPSIETECY